MRGVLEIMVREPPGTEILGKLLPCPRNSLTARWLPHRLEMPVGWPPKPPSSTLRTTVQKALHGENLCPLLLCPPLPGQQIAQAHPWAIRARQEELPAQAPVKRAAKQQVEPRAKHSQNAYRAECPGRENSWNMVWLSK